MYAASDCYYTPEQVMEKYGMSRNAVVTFALRHNIPRINGSADFPGWQAFF